MWDIPHRGPDRHDRPHRTPAVALSIERPGGRSMRGLRGRHPGADGGSMRRHAHEHPRERGPHQVRRGAVREAVLRALAEEPMHGYQLMQSFAERTGGRWRPSAGSIYPTLQQLEDEGLVAAEEVEGRRVYRLTDAGRVAVSGLPEDRPWPGRGGPGRDLRGLSREVGMAAMQVRRMGSPTAIEAAAALLTSVRRDLYRLLADDAADATGADDVGAGADDASDAGDPRTGAVDPGVTDLTDDDAPTATV